MNKVEMNWGNVMERVSMENIWRFYNGKVSGIVIALTYEQALDRANEYVNICFTDINSDLNKMQVWECVEDDDYKTDFPFAVAVAY